MRRFSLVLAVMATFAPSGFAQEAGPYKVLKKARVGGEGGWDYIYADAADAGCIFHEAQRARLRLRTPRPRSQRSQRG